MYLHTYAIIATQLMSLYIVAALYICSAQSENLCNLEIALRILRILRLHSSLEIAQPILRLRNTCAQSRDCVICMRNLRTLPVCLTVSDLLCMCSSQDGRRKVESCYFFHATRYMLAYHVLHAECVENSIGRNGETMKHSRDDAVLPSIYHVHVLAS